MTHYSYMLTAILCLIITLPLEIHKHYFFNKTLFHSFQYLVVVLYRVS